MVATRKRAAATADVRGGKMAVNKGKRDENEGNPSGNGAGTRTFRRNTKQWAPSQTHPPLQFETRKCSKHWWPIGQLETEDLTQRQQQCTDNGATADTTATVIRSPPLDQEMLHVNTGTHVLGA